MTNVIRSLSVLLLCFVFFSSLAGQSRNILDCNSVKITVDGSICTNCTGPLPNTHIAMYAMFEVYRVNPNGTLTFVYRRYNPEGRSYTFIPGILETGVEYKVKCYSAQLVDGVCYTFPNSPSGTCAGEWLYTGTSSSFSFGDIVHTWSVSDRSGTFNNNIYCSAELHANGGPFITGGLQNEEEWSVSVCKLDLSGNCQPWTSTYWQPGPMPQSIDILNDVWRLHHPSWSLWSGNYRVTVVGGKDCNPYDGVDYYFSVVKGGCAFAEESKADIHLYPNPAHDWIQIETEGWAIPADGSNYQIIDISGRVLKQGQIWNENEQISVNELRNGLYVLRMETEGRPVSKRFTITANR